ncbi:c-type cytochrome biogenesis protein CcsB [Natranaerobius thermophilus]|uniref:Cytochrome c-type biogenesis protein CcsB n=1 Tax=Natranaerobius thermophilus (strain ATCC BAA-1301 / DSM 18059 / JW/NM-WN-LF) TaxID=457570 RepID=B2A1G3_NATTJ|nr:c-type cytochrome biogenesis protein CcsB [Natranaerobius thermophilus]ACB84703.1 cytochrome c-type biogenesis protein CcsB [Natranaerobius thermophilus JW/NM-WN-LF]
MTEEQLVSLENTLFDITFVFYLVAALLYIVTYLIFKKEQKLGKYATFIATMGLIVHTASIFVRMVNAARLTMHNQFEFATWFAWGIMFCYLFIERKFAYKYRGIGSFVVPIAFLMILYASTLPSEIRPPMPALQSAWLSVHVITAILGYGAFAVACGISIMYLLKRRKAEDDNSIFNRSFFPSFELLDNINYRAVAFGFMGLTLCILTGAIWAEQAWGRYWGWDPKETWSLITWIVYSIYLHARLTRGWKGTKTAWFSIIGFLCVLFTYVGVNMLLPSEHSYL